MIDVFMKFENMKSKEAALEELAKCQDGRVRNDEENHWARVAIIVLGSQGFEKLMTKVRAFRQQLELEQEELDIKISKHNARAKAKQLTNSRKRGKGPRQTVKSTFKLSMRKSSLGSDDDRVSSTPRKLNGSESGSSEGGRSPTMLRKQEMYAKLQRQVSLKAKVGS